MASAKDLWVVEGSKVMAVGEKIAHTIDYTGTGTPAAAGTEIAYDEDGTDVSSAVLSGSLSLTGNIVTLKLFTPASAQNYRLVNTVSISGNTVDGIVDVAVFAPAPALGTITSGSYGSIAGVAVLVPRHASKAGTFSDTSNPTGVQIASLIDQVSAILDTMLGAQGFTTPVTDTEAKRVLDIFCNQEVASIVEGIHGAGRFGPNVGRGTPKGRWSLVMTDAKDFIETMAVGLERLGAARPIDLTSGIAYRDQDESGDDTYPLTQRKQFGDNAFQKNWDNG